MAGQPGSRLGLLGMGTRQGLWDLFFLKEGFGFKGLGPLEFRVQGLERKRERERARERERETERDRQTDGRTDRQTDRGRASERERERKNTQQHANQKTAPRDKPFFCVLRSALISCGRFWSRWQVRAETLATELDYGVRNLRAGFRV